MDLLDKIHLTLTYQVNRAFHLFCIPKATILIYL